MDLGPTTFKSMTTSLNRLTVLHWFQMPIEEDRSNFDILVYFKRLESPNAFFVLSHQPTRIAYIALMGPISFANWQVTQEDK